MYNSQETIFRIKQRAKEQGIAILDLQTKCDLGRNAISQAAKSQDGMKARNLFAIAEVLDCSVDYLLGRTDNPEVTYNNHVIWRWRCCCRWWECKYHNFQPAERRYRTFKLDKKPATEKTCKNHIYDL